MKYQGSCDCYEDRPWSYLERFIESNATLGTDQEWLRALCFES